LKKVLIVCILCFFFSGTAYAKNVFYSSYTDSATGRTVEYFDLDGDNVERLYFTQSYWLKDSDAFVVSSKSESRMYKYNVTTHTVEALHGTDIKCNDVGITKDNLMYMRPMADTEAERKLYCMDLNKKASSTEISAEVNSNGTAFEGDLILRRRYDNSRWTNTEAYDRKIIFSGETGKSAVGGKTYSYNEEYTECVKGKYQRWRNSWYFDIPNSFLDGKNYETVEIEVEYYLPSVATNKTLSLFVGSDKAEYTSSLVSEKWTTAVFTISKNDGKNVDFTDNYSNVTSNNFYDKYTETASNFRIMTKGSTNNAGSQIYIHKVTVRKITENKMICLGDRPWGYQIHPTRDGKFLSITGDDGNYEILIYDVEKGTWETISKKFPSPNTVANHAMINPVYNNLVLFAHEGTATQVFDRMWIYDRNTGEFYNVFKQYNNMTTTTTGEAVGHESWTADGENIVAVKYKEPNNIGKSGIIRMNKYGGEREYLNDDYDYWHCSASPDGRWIVADAKLVDSKTKIVLIDSKTGKSYVVAEPKAGTNDPWQPHPQFSPDGKKVTFSMIYRQNSGSDVLGVGIVDVSDLVNDGQYVDSLFNKTNETMGFRVSPFKIDFGGNSSNEVTTNIENLDGKEKKLSLYTAVYDNDGKMISLDSDIYNSSYSNTLSSKFSWTNNSKTLKCFLWDNENNPILTSTTAVEKLRVAKTAMKSVVLTWQPSNNLIDIDYEIYRNGTKIGKTQDLVYRDCKLTKNTEYEYEVKPIYDGVFVTSDNSCVTVTPTYSGGKWSIPSQSNNVSAPGASVKVKTNSSATVSEPTSTSQFVYWSNAGYDGLTLLSGGTTVNNMKYLSGSSQWLTFDVDDNYQSSSQMNMAWIDITYKDIGTGEIYLEYNTSDPTATTDTKSHKRSEFVIKCKNTKELLTEKIPLIDADFSGYGGYDFRIGTSNSAYISKVKVLGY